MYTFALALFRLTAIRLGRAAWVTPSPFARAFAALAAVLGGVLVATHPALAATTGASAGDFLNITPYANGIINVITGPIAQLFAIICIIGGAVAFMEGGDVHRGVKNLGFIAITVGIIIALPNVMRMVGASNGALI